MERIIKWKNFKWRGYGWLAGIFWLVRGDFGGFFSWGWEMGVLVFIWEITGCLHRCCLEPGCRHGSSTLQLSFCLFS
jgi:hypothetical protein